jgi:hypothetical protein
MPASSWIFPASLLLWLLFDNGHGLQRLTRVRRFSEGSAQIFMQDAADQSLIRHALLQSPGAEGLEVDAGEADVDGLILQTCGPGGSSESIQQLGCRHRAHGPGLIVVEELLLLRVELMRGCHDYESSRTWRVAFLLGISAAGNDGLEKQAVVCFHKWNEVGIGVQANHQDALAGVAVGVGMLQHIEQPVGFDSGDNGLKAEARSAMR